MIRGSRAPYLPPYAQARLPHPANNNTTGSRGEGPPEREAEPQAASRDRRDADKPLDPPKTGVPSGAGEGLDGTPPDEAPGPRGGLGREPASGDKSNAHTARARPFTGKASGQALRRKDCRCLSGQSGVS